MSDELIVREAVASDLPRIVDLLAQLYSGSSQESYAAASAQYEQAFASIEADERQTLYVVERDGRIVGSAVLIVVPNLTHHGASYGLVENVVTDAVERGKGYGQALMRRIAADAKSRGCYKIALMSRNERSDAHRFYKRLGFEPAHVGFRLEL